MQPEPSLERALQRDTATRTQFWP